MYPAGEWSKDSTLTDRGDTESLIIKYSTTGTLSDFTTTDNDIHGFKSEKHISQYSFPNEVDCPSTFNYEIYSMSPQP